MAIIDGTEKRSERLTRARNCGGIGPRITHASGPIFFISAKPASCFSPFCFFPTTTPSPPSAALFLFVFALFLSACTLSYRFRPDDAYTPTPFYPCRVSNIITHRYIFVLVVYDGRANAVIARIYCAQTREFSSLKI